MEATSYTAFGVGPDGRTDVKANFDSKFPLNELHNGVAHIEVRASGDSPSTCFLIVTAVTESLALDVWNRVAAKLDLVALWDFSN